MNPTIRQQAAYARGKHGEFQAAEMLKAQGYKIIKERYKTPHGEIDLIVQRGDMLVCVEVKARSTHEGALESLGRRQVQRLFAAAEHYLSNLPIPHMGDMRFDVITVAADGTLQHLEHALIPEA